MNRNIAIVGAGIGGLATAAFLHQFGVGSTVYEQAPALTDIGAGLVNAPNAARLVRRLGGAAFLDEQAVRLEVGWEFRRWEDGRVLSSERLTDVCRQLYGEDTYTAHRADLLDAIKAAVPAHDIRLSKQCVRVEPLQAGARLAFADGEVVTADVLIGADGIHSVVRSALTDAPDPTYSGLCAFRALVPSEAAPAFARRQAQTIWIGPGHHLVHYPVAAGRLVNLVAFAPAGGYTTESWTATATIDELLAEFDGWDDRLHEIIGAARTPGRWALLDRAPLERWTYGTATLLGDAAHPMFPFFAQGAAQAIEDAALLARCLSDAPDDPEEALLRYERLRRQRTTRIQLASHARVHTNHLPDGPEQQQRDAAFGAADPLVANGWIYDYDPDVACVS
jgi:salicylate hydroxylase